MARKPLAWTGTSRKDLNEFPDEVQRRLQEEGRLKNET